MKQKLFVTLFALMLSSLAFADKQGKCGNNATYYYEEATGTLTISGSGPMEDYSLGTPKKRTPWNKFLANIKTIIIKDGITATGKDVFRDCVNLTSVSIPNSVTSIGQGTFEDCHLLSELNIPSSVKEYGKFAFEGTGFKTFRIPDGFKEISTGLFTNCLNLESVIIPNSVTKIGYGAFSYCHNLKSIEIPKEVIRIEDHAFDGCESLHVINIPEGVETIDTYAFANCTGLTTVYIHNNVFIQYNAFVGCKNLQKVYIPKGLPKRIDITATGLDINKIVSVEREKLLAMSATKSTEVKKQKTIGVKKQETVAQKPVTKNQPSQEQKTQPKQEQKVVAKAEPKQEQKTIQQTAATPTTSKVIISNVDKSIPVSGQVDKNTFVVVIGNEKYEDADPVPFAENDARIFSEYCKKTLGISEKHIRAVYNAGYNDIRKALSWLKQGLSAYEGEGRVIFYYSGHGIPNESDLSAYLLPVDGDGKDIESAYPLSSLYKSLSELPAKSVLVFLDACFSGAKRNGGMLVSARGVAIKAKPQEAKGKMVIFSAAQSDETAYPFTSQQHGMFTYYLLKKLYDTKGQVTLGELGDYLRKEVKRESFDENNKIQTPTVSASAALANSWRTIRLK